MNTTTRNSTDITALPTVYTVRDVAAMLRVSTKTVYTLTADGLLPCYRFPGGLRYSRAHIDAYLSSVYDPGIVA